jgi:hypothetical protein
MDLYYYLLAILAKGMDFNRDVTPASMAGRGERDHVALAEVLKKTDCTLEQLTLSEDTLSAVLRLYLQAASAKMINLRHGVRCAAHQPFAVVQRPLPTVGERGVGCGEGCWRGYVEPCGALGQVTSCQSVAAAVVKWLSVLREIPLKLTEYSTHPPQHCPTTRRRG